eukprot:CAMPEP_0201598692 /NCGR_PEP_ID=MMETSP0492-20130828/424_1 /ASSEMBLY_ACC=CAM_ASM_000837 /TAXON_ID=420259 /ORGANISM="Thalassiosira gravida, Strain GMp14c1" /LENGTH=47 /DNA_ID= /DNA_START= /DNA_END= /DNA_ORIENTATION=
MTSIIPAWEKRTVYLPLFCFCSDNDDDDDDYGGQDVGYYDIGGDGRR